MMLNHTASQKQKEKKIFWIGEVCRLLASLFLQGTGSYSTSHCCISWLGIISIKIKKVQHPSYPLEMLYTLELFVILKKRMKISSQTALRDKAEARILCHSQTAE